MVQQSNFDFERVEQNPDRKDSQIVTFKERYVAETFIASSTIPSIGKVEMSWVPNAPPTSVAGPAPSTTVSKTGEGDAPMSDDKEANGDEQEARPTEDAGWAESDDRWMDVA